MARLVFVSINKFLLVFWIAGQIFMVQQFYGLPGLIYNGHDNADRVRVFREVVLMPLIVICYLIYEINKYKKQWRRQRRNGKFSTLSLNFHIIRFYCCLVNSKLKYFYLFC